MSDLLAELHTSHLGFFHSTPGERRAALRSAQPTLRTTPLMGSDGSFRMSTLAEPPRLLALNPGNILLSVDGREIIPPEHPVFPMGKQTSVVIVDNEDKQRTVSVDVARPKGKKLHFIEPTLVESRQLENGTGYLKVAMFPGMVGSGGREPDFQCGCEFGRH